MTYKNLPNINVTLSFTTLLVYCNRNIFRDSRNAFQNLSQIRYETIQQETKDFDWRYVLLECTTAMGAICFCYPAFRIARTLKSKAVSRLTKNKVTSCAQISAEKSAYFRIFSVFV